MVQSESCAHDLISMIKKILVHREVKRVVERTGLTRAAVLLPLFCKDGSYHILFTRRTETVKRHKGEISFPGGMYDASDGDMGTTALREAHEEIGLRPEDVALVGALDEVRTLSDFIVSPFVGVMPYPYSFVPSPEEIDEIIILPLADFRTAEVLSEEYRTYNGKTERVYTYHCGGHVIWGATARILRQFLELIPEGGLR